MKRSELDAIIKERGLDLPRWQRRAAYRGMRHKDAADLRPSERLDISAIPCGFCSQVHDPNIWPCPIGVVDGKAVTVA